MKQLNSKRNQLLPQTEEERALLEYYITRERALRHFHFALQTGNIEEQFIALTTLKLQALDKQIKEQQTGAQP